ncbi:MAG TPA: flagellar hook-basal body protein [Candidatus Deferrimicrobium sp.]
MHKGIYIALSGSVLKQDQIDLVSNNIANANTVGFKKERASFKEFLVSRISGAQDSDDGRAMSDLSATKIDFGAGTHLKTGNPLDIALDGKGFLSIEGGRYTRKGDLKVGRDGFLVTQEGLKVLGSKGPIKLAAGQADIAPSGEVRVNGKPVDTLKIVDFANQGELTELEGGYYTANLPPIRSNAIVSPGHLEASNVDVVKEMVQMITTLREFESYQKAIQMFDEAAARVNNDMAKV